MRSHRDHTAAHQACNGNIKSAVVTAVSLSSGSRHLHNLQITQRTPPRQTSCVARDGHAGHAPAACASRCLALCVCPSRLCVPAPCVPPPHHHDPHQGVPTSALWWHTTCRLNQQRQRTAWSPLPGQRAPRASPRFPSHRRCSTMSVLCSTWTDGGPHGVAHPAQWTPGAAGRAHARRWRPPSSRSSVAHLSTTTTR